MSRIDNSFSSQQLGAAESLASSTATARRAELLASPQPQAITHTPAPEVQQALSALQSVGEVRPDVLQQVAQRLSAGDFLTRAAAQQTATAILGTAPAAEQAGDSATALAPSQTLQVPAAADTTVADLGNTPGAPDVFQLLDTLNHIPLLRQEVVAEVAQRLANGQLSIPAATEPTVQAILETTNRNG
jgi:hypothetical protein